MGEKTARILQRLLRLLGREIVDAHSVEYRRAPRCVYINGRDVSNQAFWGILPIRAGYASFGLVRLLVLKEDETESGLKIFVATLGPDGKPLTKWEVGKIYWYDQAIHRILPDEGARAREIAIERTK